MSLHSKLLGAAIGTIALLAVAAAAVFAALTASLPRHDGTAAIPGLEAPVAIELDDHDVPRIRAGSLLDAFRAQGFVHAQQRFFQMDLARRNTAGELAALAGEDLLARDREQRLYQFRRRADALAERLPPEHLAWLEAYTDGVNAGLRDLGARPPEYWLLGAEPEPWTVSDSLLVVFALYTMLADHQRHEPRQGVMRAALPGSVYEFLTPSTSRFDRPILGATEADPTGGYEPVPIPPAADIDWVLRDGPLVAPPPQTGAASNQWAAGPRRTSGGVAMLANDPHLELGLPNVFYRSELYFGERVARGVGIPGVPGILIGASERLAWGVTVSYADQSDWVVVETVPGDDGRYRVPAGTERFGRSRESIEIRGQDEPEATMVTTTRWGPIVGRDWRGRPLALRATWLDPNGAGLGVLNLMRADTVQDAIDTLSEWRGPALNWMLADTAGDIGWIVNGPLPARRGFDGTVPESWADGRRGWSGTLPLPRYANPKRDMLFTANNRTLPAAAAAAVGRTWMRPMRAKRIADLLAAGGAVDDAPMDGPLVDDAPADDALVDDALVDAPPFDRSPVNENPVDRRRLDEADFAAMQLDTRVEGYDAIRTVALGVLTKEENDPLLTTVRRHIAGWSGRADADDVGFRLLHVYYTALLERVLSPLLAPVLDVDPGFTYRWPLADEPLRRLLETRPQHLLPAGFADWDAFLRDVLIDAIRDLETDPSRPGPLAAWGEANRLSAGHALRGLPLVRRLLSLPPTPQPGSATSVRVATPRRGAVIRMVVAPDRPERGILQMAGGQSGHFLSPSFMDQQPAWSVGAPSPFLAGETAAGFTLVPQAAAEPAASRTTRRTP